jgi:hypothetical protein
VFAERLRLERVPVVASSIFNCQSESPSRSLGCRDVEACSDRARVIRNFSWVVLLQRFKSHIKILEH